MIMDMLRIKQIPLNVNEIHVKNIIYCLIILLV
jgi:hypothetical protein